VLDTSVPNLARACDYLLGGGANFAVDRSLAGRITELYPGTQEVLATSRTLRAASLRTIAAAGVTQYVEVGSGLPTRPSTHAVAGRALAGRPVPGREVPGARVVYVDNDPAVTSHLASLLPPGVRAVEADLAEPEALLDAVSPFIDFARPACLVLTLVLQVLDPGTARAVAAVLVRALAPGSYVVITVGEGSQGRLPDAVSPDDFTAADVSGFLSGLDLVPPGVHQEGPVLHGVGVKRA
jgi:hypothetical protein